MNLGKNDKQVILSDDENEIYSGNKFAFFDKIATLALNSTKEYVIKIGSNNVDFEYHVDSPAGMMVEIFEDCIMTPATGTPIYEKNINRQYRDRDGSASNQYLGVLCYAAPTITTPGTQISMYRDGGTLATGSSQASKSVEVLLKNTFYKILITSMGTNTNIIVNLHFNK